MEAGGGRAERREGTPLSTKLWYGAPSLAGAALTVPIAVHLAQFYSDTVLVAVVAVVAAGVSLTAFFLHPLRIRPARRMARDPVSTETVRVHLQAIS